MKTSYLRFLLLLATLFPLSKIFAQDGSLDLSFDLDGVITNTLFTVSSNNTNAMAIQSDGKIVVVGYSYTGSYDQFTVMRLKTDGSLDSTFSSDGKVSSTIHPMSFGDRAFAVTIQNDGKILVAGRSIAEGTTLFALARYNTDGSFDTSFGVYGGVLNTHVAAVAEAYAVALQSDSKIVVAGKSYDSNGHTTVALVRYKTNGIVDSTFGTNGIVYTQAGIDYSGANSMVIQNDNKIVVTGFANNSNSVYDIASLRYNSDGSLDSTFDSDGIVTTGFGSSNGSYGNAVAIQSDGKYVVTGSGNNGLALLRYNVNGSLDNAFDTDGIVTYSVGLGKAVVVQNDGKIVVAGPINTWPAFGFELLRFDANGNLDNTFDTDGYVITPIGSNGDVANAMCLQSDGKIVLAGNSYYNAEQTVAVVRYINGTVTGINEDSKDLSSISVYPNPFHTSAFVKLTTSLSDANVTIFNVSGQTVKTITHVSGKSFSLQVSDLASGLYFMSVTQDNKEINKTKLVITD